MKISLVGYMGSGKSRIGKALADRLGLRFVDLDAEIERDEQKPISELMPIKNGLYFRKVERETLLKVLDGDNFVLSCGGGTPCYYSNMQDINASSNSFYLQLSPKELASRLMNEKEKRPLITNVADEDLLEFVAKHLFERKHFYEAATFTVRAKEEESLLEEIIKQLGK
ncbi:MAG: AAA family ATPase [Schleiferiaceae bacterium]|nr:AAA family ATPase [Schleiferiaceae bacterium]